jgi:hypothetical protein
MNIDNALNFTINFSINVKNSNFWGIYRRDLIYKYKENHISKGVVR